MCKLPAGLTNAAKLPEPIYTPAAKAEMGDHDENITYERTVEMVGEELAAKIRDTAIRIYKEAADIALTKGMIIADTKFEFGLTEDGALVLMDEVLTPDSSRYWPVEGYEDALAKGENPPSYDKQFVRDWLEQAKVNGKPVGQESPRAAPAPGGDREDRRQVPRSAAAPDGLSVDGRHDWPAVRKQPRGCFFMAAFPNKI